MSLENDQELMALATRIYRSKLIYSDQNGVSNNDKWEYVTEIAEMKTLFSDIPIGQMYMTDDVRLARAAMHVTDLRAQVFEAALGQGKGNPIINHALYLMNMIWFVRSRERLGLDEITFAEKLT